MCLAPQRRALFPHLNLSKSRPNPSCFVHFYFEMCFAPTAACTFSTAQLPKVVRSWRVLPLLTSKCASRHNGVHFFHMSTSKSRPENDVFLTLLTSKCASRHNGMQFFISHLASCLRTRRFSEPTFQPSGATKDWKNTGFRDFPTFSRTCIFSLLTFSISDLLHLLSSPSWLSPRPSFFLAVPCSSLHIVGSLASKLPSTVHSIAFHCIALHYITLQYIPLHCIATTLQYIPIALHYITRHGHYIALHCITLHLHTYIHRYIGT